MLNRPMHQRSVSLGIALLFVCAAFFLYTPALFSGPTGQPSAAPEATITPAPDDVFWDDRFGRPGVNPGDVRALAVDSSGKLYAGGDFTSAGGNPANRIVFWDGRDWQPLGDGLNGPVLAILIAADGSIYAGGSFT